jgi:hypothetical protein
MSGLQFSGSATSSTAQQVRLVQLVLDASKVRNANAAAAVVANSAATSGEFSLKHKAYWKNSHTVNISVKS